MENKNCIATKYSVEVEVSKSAKEVFNHIIDLSKWWAKKVKGKTEKLNDKFTVDFGTTWVDFQITELVPNKKVVWKVTNCNLEWIKNKTEWNDTDVVFEISEKKNITQIDFTHLGYIPSFECYEDCKMGWTEYVTESLVKFINDGKGMPQ